MTTHLLIVRVVGASPDSDCLEVKLGFADAPTTADIATAVENARVGFKQAFAHPPERIAHVVLPWVDALDGFEDEHDGLGWLSITGLLGGEPARFRGEL